MAANVNEVLRRAAGLVNGPRNPVMPGGDSQPRRLFSDAELKGYLDLVWDDCCLKLEERHVTQLRAQADVTNVPANTTVMSSSTSPALPSNFVAPIEIWEQIPGQSFWTVMRKVTDHLPMNATQANMNGLWKWEQQQVYFPGATGTINLRFAYVFRLGPLLLPTDSISIPDLVTPLSYLTASVALGGNDFFEQKGLAALYSISGIDSHVKQQTPTFRRLRRWGRPRRR